MRKLAFALLIGSIASGALAQIRVNVNGDPVNFTGVGPQKIGGRVLVPLRGVMEKIGAFVGWDSATRTVIAQKGNIDLQMRLGERTAIVNGRTVMLDVPAQSINGVTMVPLRFMGETLGAEIKWDAVTETIDIQMGDGGGSTGTTGTTGATGSTGATTGATGSTGTGGGNVDVAITSFNHTASGWTHVGDVVTFTLVGTPRAAASVTISGVATAINLTEEQTGRYVGRWTPGAGVNLEGTSAVATLRVGSSERQIQSGVPISVDTTGPAIRSFSPDDGSTVSIARPDISGVFEDTGAGIEPRTVKIRVNGKDVTGASTVNNSLFLYSPHTNLPNGLTTVDVAFADKAGNASSYRASFMVTSANNSAVSSFLHNARYYAEAGKAIAFKIEGEPGAKIVINAGNYLRNVALRESSPGTYIGSYMVKETDKFNNTPVIATVTLRSGASFTVEAPNRIPKVMGAGMTFGSATISSHANGSTAQNPLVLKGKALPRTKVQVKVTYATSVLGALRVTGAIGEQVVEVDASGNWTTSGMDLSKAVSGSNTEYTVSVIAINIDGTKATATVIKLK